MKSITRPYFMLCILWLCCIAAAHAQRPSKAFLTGNFNYTKDTAFVKVSASYSTHTVYLQKQVYAAFLKMRKAAAKDGVTLTIVSGTRSFKDQKGIWTNKWGKAVASEYKNDGQRAVKILRWSSMPGTSRHHWGTDMDLNNLSAKYYDTPTGKKIYQWLTLNADKYGFAQPFSANRNTGYQEEKWHWSYLPLAKIYLSEYVKQIGYGDISNFPGSNSAKDIGMINNWVLAVNSSCKQDMLNK